jgi:hypothetical protein
MQQMPRIGWWPATNPLGGLGSYWAQKLYWYSPWKDLLVLKVINHWELTRSVRIFVTVYFDNFANDIPFY